MEFVALTISLANVVMCYRLAWSFVLRRHPFIYQSKEAQ